MPGQVPAGWHWLAGLFSFNFPPYLLLLTVLFPLIMGYSILRYHLVRTDLLFRQGVPYAILTIRFWAATPCWSRLTLIFGQAFQVTNPFFIGVLVFSWRWG